MALYKIVYKPSLDKDLKQIPPRDKTKIHRQILSLAENPRPYGCEMLAGQKKYRIRQGDYRILYSIDDAEQKVRIIKVGHRREFYRVSEEKVNYTPEKEKARIKSKTGTLPPTPRTRWLCKTYAPFPAAYHW